MIPEPQRTAGAGVVEHLDRLRSRLAGADAFSLGWPGDLRAALGLLEGVGEESDPSLGEALGRLSLMAEVWECLADGGAEASVELPGFFSEALDRLAEGLRLGEAGEAAVWIGRESESRWGEYLALLDPSLGADRATDPWDATPVAAPECEAGPTLDLADLLRSLTATGSNSGPTDATDPGPSGRDGLAPGPCDRDARSDHEEVAESGAGWGGPVAADLGREARSLGLEPEIRDAFVADASDLFARLQGLILGLGRGGDSGRLREIGRCYHTLKGAAGSIGLVALASDIHALEDRLEQAGGQAGEELIRRLEGSLAQIEGVLSSLGGGGPAALPAGDEGREGRRSCGRDGGDSPPAQQAGEADGLIRVPADRFEELMDLCSELLTRRRAWADQAERMAQFALTTRACSHRLRASVERLAEAIPRDDRRTLPGRESRGAELAGLSRRMTEQAEDLAALAATAREAAMPMADEAEAFSRLSLRLWESLQSVRVVPVRGLFHRLVRVARDAARVEGREVEVVLRGEETGADRLLLDKAYEPLLHLVRNSVGHGIEPPGDRIRAGKPSAGRITLEARREGNTLALAVQDDGRGLDYDAIAAKGRRLGLLGIDEQPGIERLNTLIFRPGFSTRDDANAISGRGVGMDVVAREVELLRGRIGLTSRPGEGTRLELRLPARLSLEHVTVVRVGGQAFAVPTSAIEAVHRVEEAEGDGDGEPQAVAIGDRRLPAIDLSAVLGLSGSYRDSCPTFLVMTADAGAMAIRIDSIDGPLELVIRPLGPLLAGHPAISGVGLTTGGEIVPTLDVSGLLRLARGVGRTTPGVEAAEDRPKALLVDDSLSVRRVATRHLRALGFEVDEAGDGEQALGKLRERAYRLILTDLEMPRMDGFALLAELGRTGALEATSVVVTSTLTDPATRRRVLDLGARAFVAKPVVAEELADVVGAILAGVVGTASTPR